MVEPLLEELELGVLEEFELLEPLDMPLEDEEDGVVLLEDDGIVLLGVVEDGEVTDESVELGVVVL